MNRDNINKYIDDSKGSVEAALSSLEGKIQYSETRQLLQTVIDNLEDIWDEVNNDVK